MVFLAELWLPTLLSAVLVFIVSSVIHMALPIHKGDYGKIKNEDAVLESMRANDVEPGAYMFPFAGSLKEMGSPEMVEKLKRGPVGWHSLGAGAGYPEVFRITGAAAVLGYAVGHFHDSVWKGARWGTTAKFIFDGVV